MTQKNKTLASNDSVTIFLENIENKQKQEDCFQLLQICEEASGKQAKMWGANIIGFGSYHYKYDSGREGDSMRLGFSPRAAGLSIYIMPGYQFDKIQILLGKLGKHKAGKACLNIKKLSDINLKVLEDIMKFGLNDIKEKYPE